MSFLKRAKLVEDRYKYGGTIYRQPGDAIEGDDILIYCRKHTGWGSKIRASEGHHYFQTSAKMNALAILRRTFRNLQK
jgi:hypothetical protein